MKQSMEKRRERDREKGTGAEEGQVDIVGEDGEEVGSCNRVVVT